MGYTHYYSQTRDLTDVEWSQLRIAAVDLIAKSGVEIGDAWGEDNGPEIGDDVIRFNGIGDDRHETFNLNRTMRELYDYEKDDSRDNSKRFEFTKTAYKPYDVVVTALLVSAELIAPGVWEIGSDGDEGDWQRGVELAANVVDPCASNAAEDIFRGWRESY